MLFRQARYEKNIKTFLLVAALSLGASFAISLAQADSLNIIDKTNGQVTALYSDGVLSLSSPLAAIAVITNDHGETYERLPLSSAEANNYHYNLPYSPEELYIVLKGDVDLNGSVDATDALRIRQPQANLSNLQKTVADIDLTGSTDTDDTESIKKSHLSTSNSNYLALSQDQVPNLSTLNNAFSSVCSNIASNSATSVDYKDFTKKIPLYYDDFFAIKSAHDCANNHNLPVVVSKGEYDIYKTSGEYDTYETNPTDELISGKITVKTNTNLGDSTFYIHDETGFLDLAVGRNANIYQIPNDGCTPISNISQPETIGEGSTVPELATGNKKKTKIQNANKTVYRRYSINDDSGTFSNVDLGEPARDAFKVDGDGKILDPIFWSYDSITSGEICRTNSDKLDFKNGTFYTIAETGKDRSAISDRYFGRGIEVTRSNTTLDNITHAYVSSRNTPSESNLVSDTGYRYMGFYYLHDTTALALKNASVYALHSLGTSTYDLSISAVTDSTFENVLMYDYAATTNKGADSEKVAEYFSSNTNQMNDNRWGVIGSDYSKNLTFDNCVLNRIDAHRGVYNLAINNSTIGKHAITLTGYGNLSVDNTTVRYGNQFLKLRDDYGSTWNGNVIINNSKIIPPSSNNSATAVYFKYNYNTPYAVSQGYSTENELGLIHNYGYDLSLPTIEINNFTTPNNVTNLNIFANGPFSTKWPAATSVQGETPSGWRDPQGNLRYVKNHYLNNRFSLSYPSEDEITYNDIKTESGDDVTVKKYQNNFLSPTESWCTSQASQPWGILCED